MTAADRNPSTSAFVLAFAAIYLIWGSTYLGIRVAVETLPPFALAAGRFFIAGLLMLGLLRLRGAALPTPRQWRDSFVIGTCLLLGGNGLVVWAEQSVPSGIAALVIGVQPVFMVMTEWSWKGGRRPAPAVFVGMALGFCGVAYLAAPWQAASATPLNLPGLIAILLACLCWAFGSIYSRNVPSALPPLVGAAAQMLCGSLALGLVAACRGEFATDWTTVSDRSWWAFLYLIAIGSWVGYSTFVWLMKHSTPARVSTYAYVNPIVAMFLGWLILHEPISPRTTWSAVVIVAAVVIVTTQKNRKRDLAAQAPPPPPMQHPAPARH